MVGIEKKMKPYGGYHSNNVPSHDAELTEVGPGTPLGVHAPFLASCVHVVRVN